MTQDKKPLTVKVSIGLFAFKGVIILLTILVFYLEEGTDPAARTFLNGARMAIVERYNLDMTDPPYALGRLVGLHLFPALFTVLGFVFLITRKFWPLIVVVSLDILFGMSRGIPFAAIITLGLILTNSARNYLKRVKNETLSMVDDQVNDQ